MANRVPRALLISLAIPLGVIALGFCVILLGGLLFSGGNLLGGLGPLGVLIQVLGAAGLLVIAIVWVIKGLISVVRGRGKAPPDA